jgi:ATP-binding cassette, subfamily B, bacterial
VASEGAVAERTSAIADRPRLCVLYTTVSRISLAMIASVPSADSSHLGPRIVRLFRPHRGALAAIVAMILLTSVLSVIGALLVRRVFDHALFVRGGPDLEALYPLVAALIVIPILNGVLNVAQTYLTEVLGNRVLEELRNRLFEHLERLSLAFYTATRSGEVQSRLANDVGGVQTTITSTASSVVSNVVTLVSSVAAMLLLSPLLTAVSLVATPVFVLFSRRVGRARQTARRDAQASLAAMGSITQETLSVSGILLTKVFGRQEHEVDRYRAENANQANLQIRQAIAGRSFFAITHGFLGSVRRWSIWSPGCRAQTAVCRPGRWSHSRPCKRGCCSRSIGCCRFRSTFSLRWRCLGGSSS